MVWLIFLAVAALVLFWIVRSEMESSEDEMPETDDYEIEEDDELQPVQHKVPEVYELMQCYYTFAGAVESVRECTSHRSPIQYASISITKHSDGGYSLDCRYDHDGNYGVYEGLHRGSYMQCEGIMIEEDGFGYHLPKVNGETWAYDLNVAIRCFRERNGSAVVETRNEFPERNGKSNLYVKFRF